MSAAGISVIDTHQHLWDLDKFILPWLKGKDASPLNRSYLMTDYLEATQGLNIDKTIYMEVNIHPSQQTQEADYVIDMCKRDDNPMAAAVIGGFPHTRNFHKYVMRYAESPYVKGVRTVLHDPDRTPGTCLEVEFVESMKLLGRLGLSFDLCMRPEEIIDGARLADKCPGTQFIVDHCGNMSIQSRDAGLRESWQKGMRAIAALENVVCKISGIVVTAHDDKWEPAELAPNIEFCLELFGEDRVIFGGDWPVCTMRSSFRNWLAALQWIVRDRSPEFQRKLFRDNAMKFYGLN